MALGGGTVLGAVRGGARAAALLVALLLAPLAAAGAQQAPAGGDTASGFSFDRLRLRGLGGWGGAVKPEQMVTTQTFGIEADYGEIVPRWRVVFSVAAWASHLNETTLRRYRDQLRDVVSDPAGDDTVDVGSVRVSDIVLAVDGRWSPRWTRSTFLRPYAGAGVAAHVLNAEGRAIENTFVERALDNIAVSPAVLVGLDAVLFRKVAIGMQARYDVVNAARQGSLRVGGEYFFDRPRAASAAGGAR